MYVLICVHWHSNQCEEPGQCVSTYSTQLQYRSTLRITCRFWYILLLVARTAERISRATYAARITTYAARIATVVTYAAGMKILYQQDTGSTTARCLPLAIEGNRRSMLLFIIADSQHYPDCSPDQTLNTKHSPATRPVYSSRRLQPYILPPTPYILYAEPGRAQIIDRAPRDPATCRPSPLHPAFSLRTCLPTINTASGNKNNKLEQNIVR